MYIYISSVYVFIYLCVLASMTCMSWKKKKVDEREFLMKGTKEKGKRII